MRKARLLFITLLLASCAIGQTRQSPGGPQVPPPPPPPQPARKPPPPPPLALTPVQIHAVVDSLCSRLQEAYIFPDTAARIAQYLQAQYEKGAYSNYRDPRELVIRLRSDLRTAHHDDHLRLEYRQPERETGATRGQRAGNGEAPQLQEPDTAGEAQRRREDNARRLAEAREKNFSFVRAEVLPGNIGYVRLDGFTGFVDEAMPTISSAFRFVSHTQALIIDVRSNGGGSPWMVTRVESYFFPERTHMNDIVSRYEGTTEMWTDPGKTDGLYLSMPVYILACRGTHSAAEDFTYGMQSIHRAIIVGDTTIGGAHPTRGYEIGLGFFAMIPGARSLNPYTHTDWEGTGVRPDVLVAPEKALEAAESAFFTRQIQQAGTDEEKARFQWQFNNLKASLVTVTPDSAALAPYAGVYEGGLEFYVRGRDLYCRNPERGGGVFRCRYFAPGEFVLDENVELKFTRDGSGKVNGMEMHWSFGGVSYKARNR